METPRTILEWKDTGPAPQLHVNKKNLEEILENVNGKKLAVISIIGPLGTGKSFLMSLMVRYLKFLERSAATGVAGGREDWMFTNEPLKGFEFKSSMNLITGEIQMWPKPFLIGEDLALLLLDTPGIFEPGTSLREWAGGAGTTLLISSCTIFNIAHNLQEDSLATLETFLEYGNLLTNESVSNAEGAVKNFQKILFLIRDWTNPSEFKYGNGSLFIQKKLEYKEGMTSESKVVRDFLKANVEEMDCYLMPNPGDSEMEFEQPLDAAYFDSEFATCLKNFITTFIDPARIRPKIYQGTPLTSATFTQLIEGYAKTFNADFNFTVDMSNVSIQMHLEMEVIKYVQEYRTTIARKLSKKSTRKQSHLEKHHANLKEFLINKFKTKSKCDPKSLDTFIVKLSELIDNEYNKFSNQILLEHQSILKHTEKDALEQLEAQMEKLTIQEQATNGHFENAWIKATEAVKEKYREKIDKVEKPLQNEFHQKIHQQFLNLYNMVKSKNESKVASMLESNEPYVDDALDIYNIRMAAFDGTAVIHSAKLEEAHQASIDATYKLFNKRVTIQKDLTDVLGVLKQKLDIKIQETYQEILRKNDVAIQAVKNSLSECISNILKSFEDKAVKVLNSSMNPSQYFQYLKRIYEEEIKSATCILLQNKDLEKSVLTDFQQEAETKLAQMYEEYLKLAQSKVDMQTQQEEHILNSSVSDYLKHLNSRNLTKLTPSECINAVKEEKDVAINNCRRKLEQLNCAELESRIQELIQNIDLESQKPISENQNEYERMQKNMSKLIREEIQSFQRKISLIPTDSCFSEDDLIHKLRSYQTSSLQSFSSQVATYTTLPSEKIGGFRQQLQNKLQELEQEKIELFKSNLQKRVDKIAAEKIEEVERTISNRMTLHQKSYTPRPEFNKTFSEVSEIVLSNIEQDLIYTNLSKTSKQQIFDAVKDIISTLSQKLWSAVERKNQMSEDKLREQIKSLKCLYFDQSLANIENRTRIANQLMSELKEELLDWDVNSAERFKVHLEQDFHAVDQQIDADREQAKYNEKAKEEIVVKFQKELYQQNSENDGDKLIDMYVATFSKQVNNETIISALRQDLQVEKSKILRDKQEQQQSQQIEQLIELLTNEYKQQLQKRGVSQNGKVKQNSVEKFTLAFQKMKFEVSPTEYRQRFEDKMAAVYRECEEDEESKVSEEKMTEIITHVCTVYRKEMNKHFQTPKYYNLQILSDLHSDAVRVAMSETPDARSDDEAIRQRINGSLNEALKEFDAKNSMNVPTSLAIGIDLGTTYSCVGVYMNGKVEIIPNDLGNKTTPSYVYYAADEEVVVGEAAKSGSHMNPERTIYEVKRLVGRAIEDPAIQGDIAKWPFKVLNERGKAKVQVGERTYFPEEVSSEILKKMKTISEEYLNQEVKSAVITVPAYFTDGQKAATKLAGEEAGLEILRIISEPTAAAIAYNLNWKQGAKFVKGLVYDMGGGTFDVALFQATRGDIKIINVDGNTHLGGVDFDNEMVVHCAKEFKVETGIDMLADQESKDWKKKTAVNRKLLRLKRSCEEYKKDLTTARSITVAIDNIHEGHNLRVKVEQKQFQRMIEKYVDDSLELVKKVLTEAQMSKDDIEEIVLIGGSTRIPLVREKLLAFFQKPLNTTINPDEAVAVGAAYEAAVLNGRRAVSKGEILEVEFAPKGFSIKDITPMAYGIEIEGGNMCVLIPKQSQVPTQVSRDFLTAYHHQTSVQIVIYEGEDPTARNNTLVGEFYLNGIPPALAGRHTIRVTMVVSLEGIISVTAACIENGVSKNLTVRAHTKRMTRKDRA